uniref:Soluble scavenger receptor cysteine-rich domain-containing protein SSC5D n=1 Tax=Cyclopterus lumpus TaxID=8103 RepID=A0A8C3G6B5_CYCLU
MAVLMPPLSVIVTNRPIRLMNGTGRCSGRLEIYHNGQWGTICDDRWGMQEGTVACQELNCGSALSVKYNAHFGRGHGQVWLDDVECTGHEKSLSDCPHRVFGEHDCDHNEDASVVCSDSQQLRLVNGTDRCSGRVEIRYDNQWGTVCDDDWDIKDAQVVCRAMDCGTAQTTKIGSFFGQGQGDIWLDDVDCFGNETSLIHCRHPSVGENNCGHGEDAGVVCSGIILLITLLLALFTVLFLYIVSPQSADSIPLCFAANIRLINGTDGCSGRLEFYHGVQWASASSVNWGMNEAAVVCREMNCGDPITNTAEYGHGTGQTWHNQIECSGSELTLNQCPQRPFTNKTCNTTSIAGVLCTGLEVRLANGKDECTGRVEVRHGDVWQTVCDTDWTMTKAQMVCDHLECGKAMNAPGGAHFGQGVGSVVEASNSCFDNVTSLEQCSLRGFREAGCGHDRDAGALCAAQIRLVGGSSQCSGRVEIFYKGQWGTVCDDEWELANADVVCRQLGCGHAVTAPKSAHFGRGTGPIWLDNVECTGDESALTHCTHPGFGENNCGHSEDAGEPRLI